METFIWAMVVIFALDISGKVITLYTRDFTRKPGVVAAETIINTGFMVWAIWVLAQGA